MFVGHVWIDKLFLGHQVRSVTLPPLCWWPRCWKYIRLKDRDRMPYTSYFLGRVDAAVTLGHK